MSKLIFLLLNIIYSATANIFGFEPLHYGFEANNGVEPEFETYYNTNSPNSASDEEGNLWVLKIEHEINSTRLRKSSYQEESYFDSIIEPMRPTLQRRLNRKISKPKTEEPLIDYKAIQEETNKAINKFILSIQSDLDTIPNNIQEEDYGSMIFYIKEYFTLLLVSYERQEWRYILGPPSPLPQWFFEVHPDILREGDNIFVEIPYEIKFELFQSLIHMFKKFSSYLV